MIDPQSIQLFARRIANAKVGQTDFVAFGHHNRTIDDIAQLPNIAGPMVGQQPCIGSFGKLYLGFAVLISEVIVEKVDQHLNIAFPVSKRGNVQFIDTETVEQIFAKTFFRYEIFEVAVGRADHAAPQP